MLIMVQSNFFFSIMGDFHRVPLIMFPRTTGREALLWLNVYQISIHTAVIVRFYRFLIRYAGIVMNNKSINKYLLNGLLKTLNSNSSLLFE